jgi:hypothetical protein
MNDETTMTKQQRGRCGSVAVGSAAFVIRVCRLIRHSGFVIRHFPASARASPCTD